MNPDQQQYTYEEIQALADVNCLGQVQFEDRVAKNTGKVMRIGKVAKGDGMELFCKKSSFDQGFHLCNVYRDLGRSSLFI